MEWRKLVSVAAQDLEVCCNVADFLAVACKSRVLVKPALQKLELFRKGNRVIRVE
jgi:hypothetical protein